MKKIIIIFTLFFVINISVFAQGVANGFRFDMTSTLSLDGANGQFAQVFIPDYFNPPSNGKFTLVFHLHSASWAAEDEVYKSQTNAILFNIHLGGFSSSYQSYFTDQQKFQQILNAIIPIAFEFGYMPNPKINRLIMTSFSAGYAGVREIFKTQSYYDKIDVLTLADGLHSNSDPAAMATQMQDFVKFAKDSRDLTKVFLLTHSSIPTPGYQSTTQTADYLINEIGAVRKPFSRQDEIGTQYSRCDTGYFHLKGYLGDTASDHLKHLYNMHKMLGQADSLLDDLTLGFFNVRQTKNSFTLLGNYPNPFNPITLIRYYLPKPSYVNLEIFNIAGQKIKTLVSERKVSGIYEVLFDAGNLATGTYFCKMESGKNILINKMLLLK